MSQFNYDSNAPSAVFAECISNSKQIFQLINSILPAESCLSYEVLPLELKGNNLTVGIMDSANQNALDFLHPLAISFGYNLNLKLIDSQTHQLILAAYFKNPISAQPSNSQQDRTIVDVAPNQTVRDRDWDKTVVDAAPNPPFNKQDWNKTIVDAAPNPSFNNQDFDKTIVDTSPNPPFNKQDWNKTIVDAAPNPPFNKQDFDKTIVDTSPNPPFNKQDWNKTIVDAAPNQPFNKQDFDKTIVDATPGNSFHDRDIEQKPPVDASMTLTEIPEDFDFALNLVAQTKAEQLDDSQPKQPEIISSEPQISHLIRESHPSPNPNLSFDFDEELSFLNPQAESANNSTDFLSQFTCEITGRRGIQGAEEASALSPSSSFRGLSSNGENREITPTKISWRELLEKTLTSEIDRLQLDRTSDRSSIVASKDGVNQSTLEKISLPTLKSLIDEIKIAAKLPLTPLTTIKKVAMERFHQQERVLLRLEFAPSQSGETVTIQILRDEALKRYEQKQMDKMSEQVFSLAQKLEKTLRKMQVCFGSAKLNNLQNLRSIHQEIDRQLQLLDR